MFQLWDCGAFKQVFFFLQCSVRFQSASLFLETAFHFHGTHCTREADVQMVAAQWYRHCNSVTPLISHSLAGIFPSPVIAQWKNMLQGVKSCLHWLTILLWKLFCCQPPTQTLSSWCRQMKLGHLLKTLKKRTFSDKKFTYETKSTKDYWRPQNLQVLAPNLEQLVVPADGIGSRPLFGWTSAHIDPWENCLGPEWLFLWALVRKRLTFSSAWHQREWGHALLFWWITIDKVHWMFSSSP